jgi:capsular exopolysaccharide synthesis family protein
MRLHELKSNAKRQTVVITSAKPKDGKSTVAMNLATVLAEKGQHSVLLLEADLHCPIIAATLGVPAAPGLADCLQGSVNPLSAVRRLEPLGWYLLQAGERPSNPTELLQTAPVGAVLEKLSTHFEWILIDTPPLAPLSDAVSLSRHADVSLLVVRADHTPLESVDEALALLRPGRVAGIVLNAAEDLNQLYSRYERYYGIERGTRLR